MPFGFTNALSIVQALMNKSLRRFHQKFVSIFFDEILVYSKDVRAHAKYLQSVFDLLKAHNFILNRKKCDFTVSPVEYLGHIVSVGGMVADPKKTEAMWLWLAPKDLKGLHGFLGLTGYYRRFVKSYGIIANPLMDLTKKDAFIWTEAT